MSRVWNCLENFIVYNVFAKHMNDSVYITRLAIEKKIVRKTNYTKL